MTLYSADSFDWADPAHTIDRVDSTITPGLTDGAGTLDPLTWVEQAGAWGISSHQAYTNAAILRGVMTVPIGQADVDISVVLVNLDDQGITFRWTSSLNLWWLRNNTGSSRLELVKRDNGVQTIMGSVGGTVAGDTIRVVVSGDSITCYRNGNSVIAITDSFNNTATNHGCFNNNNTSARLDNWSASSPPTPTAYSTDSFNRADSSSVVGSTDGTGSLDPLTWTTKTGTCGISSNSMYASALTSSVGIASVDLATGDADLSLTIGALGGGTALMFRYSDIDNYWLLIGNGATVRLLKIVAGAVTTVGSQSGSTDGDVLRVVANGSSITCYRNGSLLYSATDSFNSTETEHGFYTQTSTTGRVDNWSASPPPGSTPQALDATETQTPTIATATTYARMLTATQTQTPTLSVPTPTPQALTATETQTPSIATATAHARTLTATQTQTPTLTPVESNPIALSLDLAEFNPAGLPATTGFATAPVSTPAQEFTRWDVRAVDISNVAVYAYYSDAKVLNITWNYNAPDTAEVAIPINNADLAQLDPDAITTREIQIWRNDYLLFVGKPTHRRADHTGRMMVFSCSDPTWYLTKRYVGRANRVNRLTNGSFETGIVSPWGEYDPGTTMTTSVASTHRVIGTDALRIICTDVSQGPFVYQTIVATAGPAGMRLFLTAWYYVANLTASSPYDAGLFLIRSSAVGTGAGKYSYAKIKANTVVGEWVRLETLVRIPPNQTETIQARLYPVDGEIWWDSVTLVADEVLGWGDGIDQGEVVKDVVNYLQGKGKFATLSPEKTDCHIRPLMPTTGVEVHGGRRYRLSDHQKGFDGSAQGSGVLDHYLNALNGIDWRFEPISRILRGHYPAIGVDRTDVTFTFRHFPTAPERDTSYGIVGWQYSDSIDNAANQVVELGGWGGTAYPGDPSREEGGYTDLAHLGGVSLEMVETAPQGMPISQLAARAQARGRRLSWPIATPQIILAEPRNPTTNEIEYELIGVLLPGDTIAVDVVDGTFVMAGEWRAAQVSLNGETDELAVTVNPVRV